jgi:hypothetical protein
MDTADIINKVVTFISIVVALWQIKARLNIQKMLQQESFHLHRSVSLVLDNCQRAIEKLKADQIPDAIDIAGRAEGGAQMLLQQTAKIVCHYHNPIDADIDDWIARGKIDVNYKPIFRLYSQKSKGLVSSICSKIKEKYFDIP